MFMCVVNPSIGAIMFICWCVKSVWLNDSPSKRKCHFDKIFVIVMNDCLHRKLSKWQLPCIAELWDYRALQRIYHVYPSPVSWVWTLLPLCGYACPISRHLSPYSDVIIRVMASQNHPRLGCLLNSLFMYRSKSTSKLHVTGPFERNPPVTGAFPSPRACNSENVSIWWRHHQLGSSDKIQSQ